MDTLPPAPGGAIKSSTVMAEVNRRLLGHLRSAAARLLPTLDR